MTYKVNIKFELILFSYKFLTNFHLIVNILPYYAKVNILISIIYNICELKISYIMDIHNYMSKKINQY